ncbi:protein ECT2-like [Ornithodoros turicata]|uniref:protein ECT2-like n=1 Tax=Ornithodoros turicata TaxID=34597 RepID=UPI003139EEB0
MAAHEQCDTFSVNSLYVGDYTPAPPRTRICIIGHLKDRQDVVEAALCHGVPITFSDTGEECFEDNGTIFITDVFEGEQFTKLKEHSLVLGPVALLQCTERDLPFPDKGRPVYNLSMSNVVIVFAGFKSKKELSEVLQLARYMGASVRDKISRPHVTHCVADSVISQKYPVCNAFKIPIMKTEWLREAWKRRDDRNFHITSDEMMKMKLDALTGCRVAFLGFPEDEQKHMEEVAVKNGAKVVNVTHPFCHYLVVDDSNPIAPVLPEALSPSTQVVKSEWFWASIQCRMCFQGDKYIYEQANPPTPAKTNGCHESPAKSGGFKSETKRRRLQETVAHQLAQEAAQTHVDPFSPESPRHKRRSSVSCAGNRSISILDVTPISPKKCLASENLNESKENGAPDLTQMSKRQQVCWELLQTETNYVAILHTIITLFKIPLENPDTPGEPLLDPTEIKIIFGNLPPIYDVHKSLQLTLQRMMRSWREEHSIGEAILMHKEGFARAYPSFVNYFEKTKETLIQCDTEKPRFHAFLKRCQTKPECGRQSLVELLIRPVQRLGSMILLLKEIQKRTPKSNGDYLQVEQAIKALNEVMLNINEGKRKTESQVVMFDIFNDIENCPPNLLSGHRFFVCCIDAVEIGDGGLSRRGDNLVLYLFSDVLELCRRRTKAATSSKSPVNPTGTLGRTYTKNYKHVRLVSLYEVRRIVDITDDNDFKNTFGLVLLLANETTENLYTFAALCEKPAKTEFLTNLCRYLGKIYNKPDHETFLTEMRPEQVALDPSVQSTAFSKAIKYATKKGEKLSRVLSIRKTGTPRQRLSRAVSTFISPLRTMATQSSPLRSMRLASSSNLNEFEAEETSSLSSSKSCMADRKVKSHSYGASATKNL